MKKFWLVWCIDASVPNVTHPTYESACNEAERLARKFAGRRFEVMERMASVAAKDVDWIGELPIPF